MATETKIFDKDDGKSGCADLRNVGYDKKNYQA